MVERWLASGWPIGHPFFLPMSWRQNIDDRECEIFRAGFELLHPTAGSGIMEKLCTEGRAERIKRAKGAAFAGR